MVLTTTRRGAADWVVSIHPQRTVGSHDPARSSTRNFGIFSFHRAGAFGDLLER